MPIQYVVRLIAGALMVLVAEDANGQDTLGVAGNSGRGRSSHGNEIISLQNPVMKLRVDPTLTHLGILNFQLKKVAQVERYLYGQTRKDGRLDRLLILQLEAINPGLKGTYSFEVVNPTRIGRFDYQTDIGVFNFAQAASANPGAEAAHTRAYLTRNGINISDDFVVARFARAVGPAKKHEIIFFYLESLPGLGLTRAAIEAGSGVHLRERIFQEVSARARGSFTIEDWDTKG